MTRQEEDEDEEDRSASPTGLSDTPRTRCTGASPRSSSRRAPCRFPSEHVPSAAELADQHGHAAAARYLLLVFIFVELLYAVRVCLRSRELVAEPFLIVGILAGIEAVVVLSVEAAKLLEKGPEFSRAIVEIGVLGVLSPYWLSPRSFCDSGAGHRGRAKQRPKNRRPRRRAPSRSELPGVVSHGHEVGVVADIEDLVAWTFSSLALEVGPEVVAVEVDLDGSCRRSRGQFSSFSFTSGSPAAARSVGSQSSCAMISLTMVSGSMTPGR